MGTHDDNQSTLHPSKVLKSKQNEEFYNGDIKIRHLEPDELYEQHGQWGRMLTSQ